MRTNKLWRVGIVAVVGLALGTGASSAQQEVCAGYDAKITRFGPNAISQNRSDSPAEFQRLFAAHREELEAILHSKGMGHLVDQIFDAVASGRGLSERTLEPGETFDWMALRRGGAATVSGEICYASTRDYEAYEVTVTEETSTTAEAQCSLNVTSDCAAGTLSVDASGSSDGVVVTSSGSSQNILSGTSKSSSSAFENRYSSGASFTASARATGSRTVKTHTFTIPKVCLNLAYNGAKTTTSIEEIVDTCTETASVNTCTATAASCVIDVEATSRSRRQVQVGVTGHWDAASANAIVVPVVGPRGDTIAELREFPTTLTLSRPGTYTFNGTAINEAGESQSCTAQVEVDPRWVLRGFLGPIYPDDGVVRTASLDNTESTKFDLHSGEGVGVELEYLFSRRLGLNGTLAYGQLDSMFQYDDPFVWLMESADVDYFTLTVGPNFHLTPKSRVDFYLGPFIGYADSGEAEFNLAGEEFEIDFGSGFTYGALVGLDIPLGSTSLWGVHLGARFLEVETDYGEEENDLDLNPQSLEVGFSRRW